MLLVQENELGRRRPFQVAVHLVLQHVIVHGWAGLHWQAVLRLVGSKRVVVVHGLVHHVVWTQMIGLMLVHVGHLVMVHRRRRLDRVLLMVLVAYRWLLDRWRINHVGHGCVFPLFLALQERRDVERRFRVIDNVIIEFIIS